MVRSITCWLVVLTIINNSNCSSIARGEYEKFKRNRTNEQKRTDEEKKEQIEKWRKEEKLKNDSEKIIEEFNTKANSKKTEHILPEDSTDVSD